MVLACRCSSRSAVLIGMNCEGELRLHLRAAQNNGVTSDEIKEVLMHSVIYCAIPAANATFHLAEEVWEETVPANSQLSA